MFKNKFYNILVFSFIFIFHLTACSTDKNNKETEVISSKEQKINNQVKTANKAPDFTLKNINDEDVTLASFSEKVIILNFWATWCPPCRAEIPDFVELYKQYNNQGLEIIGVSLDNDKSLVKPFADENNINYPVLYGNSTISELYGGIKGIPTTFIINKKGEITNKFTGFRDKQTFEDAIKKLL